MFGLSGLSAAGVMGAISTTYNAFAVFGAFSLSALVAAAKPVTEKPSLDEKYNNDLLKRSDVSPPPEICGEGVFSTCFSDVVYLDNVEMRLAAYAAYNNPPLHNITECVFDRFGEIVQIVNATKTDYQGTPSVGTRFGQEVRTPENPFGWEVASNSEISGPTSGALENLRDYQPNNPIRDCVAAAYPVDYDFPPAGNLSRSDFVSPDGSICAIGELGPNSAYCQSQTVSIGGNDARFTLYGKRAFALHTFDDWLAVNRIGECMYGRMQEFAQDVNSTHGGFWYLQGYSGDLETTYQITGITHANTNSGFIRLYSDFRYPAERSLAAAVLSVSDERNNGTIFNVCYSEVRNDPYFEGLRTRTATEFTFPSPGRTTTTSNSAASSSAIGSSFSSSSSQSMVPSSSQLPSNSGSSSESASSASELTTSSVNGVATTVSGGQSQGGNQGGVVLGTTEIAAISVSAVMTTSAVCCIVGIVCYAMPPNGRTAAINGARQVTNNAIELAEIGRRVVPLP